MTKLVKQILIFSLMASIFFLPIFLYFYQFGIGLWEEHEKWAETGSFFSGIYSPIIALLALTILALQIKSQKTMNKHHYDLTCIQENEKNIDFYISKLELYLSKITPSGESIQELLNSNFSHLTEEQLRSDEGKAASYDFIKKYRMASDIWISLYPILKGLGTPKELAYELSFSSSYLKTSTILSLETCTALDKVYFNVNEEIETEELYFWKH